MLNYKSKSYQEQISNNLKFPAYNTLLQIPSNNSLNQIYNLDSQNSIVNIINYNEINYNIKKKKKKILLENKKNNIYKCQNINYNLENLFPLFLIKN